MPEWNLEYYNQLNQRFSELAAEIPERIRDVAPGRVAPALDDLAIGSGRQLRSAVLFFDIRNFTSRTSSPEPADLKKTLLMLDCVIPTVMRIIYDHDGYVEKNTGDGVMAVIGIEKTDPEAANLALYAALACFFAIKFIVNPALQRVNIDPVDARIGIDLGPMLIARIGTHTGSADHPRNFLTAVGPSPNIACKLQGKAGTNEIWVGDLVKRNVRQVWQHLFVRKDEGVVDWPWIYKGTTDRYCYWHFNAVFAMPQS